MVHLSKLSYLVNTITKEVKKFTFLVYSGVFAKLSTEIWRQQNMKKLEELSYLVQYFSLLLLGKYLNHIFLLTGQPMCVRDTRVWRGQWPKLTQFLLICLPHHHRCSLFPRPLTKIDMSYGLTLEKFSWETQSREWGPF